MTPADPRELLDIARLRLQQAARLLDMLPADALGIASNGQGPWASHWHKLPVHRRALSDLIKDIDAAKEPTP